MSRRVVVDLPDDGGQRFKRRMEGGWLEVDRPEDPELFGRVMGRSAKVVAWLLAACLVGCVFLASTGVGREAPPASQELPHRIRMT